MAKRTKNKGVVEQPVAEPVWPLRTRDCLGKWHLLLACAAVLIATLRIVATYPVFNHTIDEPAHIACGMEWLDKGRYTLETQHPPLSRIFSALGPFLAGERNQGRPTIYNEGAAILYHNGKYERNLTLARIGTLPFFWLACVAIYLAARRWYGGAQAGLAVLSFTLLPPILAHASLATTDMALTATMGLALYAVFAWSENPTPGWAAAMGACCALALVSKFSSLAFLPACIGAILVWRVVSELGSVRLLTARHAMTACIALLVCALTIWATYRFSFRHGVPAPEFFDGIQAAYGHQANGHPSYLLGKRSDSGFLIFYPVALAVKTPLGFLFLLAGGIVLAWKKRQQVIWLAPLAAIAGMFAVGMYSRINIGTRHVLPIYFFFALLVAAAAWECLAQKNWLNWTAMALLGWMAVSGAWNHPDYLAYFNELAGNEPEKILADSDLDWGQDMLRLSARLREAGAPSVTINPFIGAYLHDYHGFPPIQPSDPVSPSPGWNAVSITVWKVARMGLMDEHPEVQLWPDGVKMQERIGRGTLLYYFKPGSR
jgi:hypothetical protein